MVNIDKDKELMDKIYDELSIEDLQIIIDYLNNKGDLEQFSDLLVKEKIIGLDEIDKKKIIKIVKMVLTQLYSEKAIAKDRGGVYIRKKVSRNSGLYIIIGIIALIILYFLKSKNYI